MQNASVKNPKPRFTVLLYNYLIFFAPFVALSAVITTSGKFEHEIVLQIFKTKSFMALSSVLLLSPLAMYFYFMRNIKNYDGTEQSLIKANKAFKSYTILSLAVPVVMNLITPYIICRECGIDYLDGGNLIIWGGYAGIGLYSTPFYVLFTVDLAKYMKFIPMVDKYKGFGILSAALLIGAFSSFGACATVFAFMTRLSEPGLDVNRYLIRVIYPYTFFAVGMCTLDMLFFMFSKNKKINIFDDFAGKVSQGDYTSKDIDVDMRDVLGVLSKDFNTFSAETRQLIGAIQSSGQVTAQTANQLISSIEQMNTVVSDISTKIDAIKGDMSNQAAGVEETRATVNQITGNLNVLGDNISKQGESIEVASSAIEQMVANIKSVNGILEHNSETIVMLNDESSNGQKRVQEAVETAKKISEESAGMQEASKVISNIASQTNLLAMNAAIEAAHAGESGKGFAVVADEIRKLSEDSNRQSKDITELLKNLEVLIGDVLTKTSAVQTQFTKIYDLAQNVQNQEAVITQAMNEQSEGSVQVMNSMRDINDQTGFVKQSSSEMLTGSREVLVEMDKLSEIASRISSMMGDMSQSTVEMDEAISVVNDAVAKNSEAAEMLNAQTEKFII